MKNNVTTLKAHISLNVKNIENSISFYKKLFDLEPLKVQKGYAKFDVENPPLNLALNERSFKERGALSHLGIQVASTKDVLETRKRWNESGLSTEDEMQTNCCYALQDKTWTTDPDGNEWEVFVVLEDSLAETNMCCETNKKETIAEQKQGISDSECCASEANPISINKTFEKSCC